MVRSGRGDKVHYELRDSGGNSLESLNNREVSSNCHTPAAIWLPAQISIYVLSIYLLADDCLNQDHIVYTQSHFQAPPSLLGRAWGWVFTYKAVCIVYTC